jgi:tetratricopeptide (TPR) repeat protein
LCGAGLEAHPQYQEAKMRKSSLLPCIGYMALYSVAAAGQTTSDSPAEDAIALIQAATGSRADGFYARAEAQYKQSLVILEKMSGNQSADLTPALNGLAEVYFDERRYSDAESLTRRSASLVEAALGPDHPLVATSLHNLAAIYHAQGQYAKAEPLYLRALEIREAALGPKHPFVAATLVNLAELARARGDYNQAAARYARAVAIREEAFGLDDPRVVETRANYVAVLRKTRRKCFSSPNQDALTMR